MFKSNVWYDHLPDYVDRAFKYAREADPHALLFYNDYNSIQNKEKRGKIIKMIKSMQEKKVPIDGMGIQFHVDATGGNLSRENIAETIKSFGELGLQVHITEMDVGCPSCTNGHNEIKQAQIYEDALAACFIDNPGVCTAFLTWGFTDKYTWRGTNEHPLPFDENFNMKRAYNSMLSLLQGKSEEPESEDSLWLQ